MPDEKPHCEVHKTVGLSNLSRLAGEGGITDAELSFIKKLTLRDYPMVGNELTIINKITSTIVRESVSTRTWVAIQHLRRKYGLQPLPELP